MYYVSKSWNSHKIFVKGRRHMEKPCKIINIFLIMGPKIRYVTIVRFCELELDVSVMSDIVEFTHPGI